MAAARQPAVALVEAGADGDEGFLAAAVGRVRELLPKAAVAVLAPEGLALPPEVAEAVVAG